MSFDATGLEERGDAERLARERAAVVQAYRDIFDGPKGEAVLLDLGRAAGAFESNFVPGDPYQTAFREGRRHLYMRILKTLQKQGADLVQFARKAYDHG